MTSLLSQITASATTSITRFRQAGDGGGGGTNEQSNEVVCASKSYFLEAV